MSYSDTREAASPPEDARGAVRSARSVGAVAILSFAFFVPDLLAGTNAPVADAALPNAGISVLRVFGAMVVVMAVFLGGVWLFRNWQRLSIPAGRAPKLNVFEARSLAPRQTLYVVGYQQQRMLIASTPAGIALVSHLPAADETEPASTGSPSFQQVIQQMLQRKP